MKAKIIWSLIIGLTAFARYYYDNPCELPRPVQFFIPGLYCDKDLAIQPDEHYNVPPAVETTSEVLPYEPNTYIVSANCMGFNGSTDFVEIDEAGNRAMDTQSEFSLTGWFKADDINWHDPATGSASQALVMYGYDDIKGGNNVLKIENGHLRFVIQGFNETQNDLIGGTQLKSDEWHHFTLTYGYENGDGHNNIAVLYLDGMLEATASVEMQMNNDSRLLLGMFKNPKTGAMAFPFKGQIDDVRLYDRALVPLDVQRIYKSGNTGETRNIAFSPIFKWKMRNASGDACEVYLP